MSHSNPGPANPGSVKNITPRDLKTMLDNKEDIQVIDVREPHEYKQCNIGAELIPKGEVFENLDKIRKDVPVIIHCKSGGRSTQIIRELQSREGYTNLINLEGGILRWSDDVDSSILKY